jgi:hypothetical protein
MTARINRRGFLASLLALGATVALPVPVAQATPAQVAKAWQQLKAAPWMFHVNDSMTITDGVDVEPQVRSEVFDLYLDNVTTPAALISQVEGCIPLASHYQNLALDRLGDVQIELDDEDLAPGQRRALLRLAKALSDDDDGWHALITTETLQESIQTVRDWLADPIQWEEMEYFPRDWGSQGKAMAFFESLPFDTQQALGVEIIEGDHPGSTYFAAELHNDIEDANKVAADLGLPFRFKSV